MVIARRSRFQQASAVGTTDSLDPANTLWAVNFEDGTVTEGTPEQTASYGPFSVQRVSVDGTLSGAPYKRAHNAYPTPLRARQGLRSMYAISEDPEETHTADSTRRLHVLATTNAGRILDGETRYFGFSVLWDTNWPTMAQDGSWTLQYEIKHNIDNQSPPYEIVTDNVGTGTTMVHMFNRFIGTPTSAAGATQEFNVLKRQTLQRGKWLDVVGRMKCSAHSSGASAGFLELWERWVDDTPAGKANPPAYSQITAQGGGDSNFTGTHWEGATTLGVGSVRMMPSNYCSPHTAVEPQIHFTDCLRIGTTFDSVVPA